MAPMLQPYFRWPLPRPRISMICSQLQPPVSSVEYDRRGPLPLGAVVSKIESSSTRAPAVDSKSPRGNIRLGDHRVGTQVYVYADSVSVGVVGIGHEFALTSPPVTGVVCAAEAVVTLGVRGAGAGIGLSTDAVARAHRRVIRRYTKADRNRAEIAPSSRGRSRRYRGAVHSPPLTQLGEQIGIEQSEPLPAGVAGAEIGSSAFTVDTARSADRNLAEIALPAGGAVAGIWEQCIHR